MDIIKAILTRRSIRDYKKKKIPKDILEKIIKCGLNAPSSKNSQPWRFHIIEDPDKIRKLGDLLINSINLDDEPSDPSTGKIKNGFESSIKASGYIIKKAPVVIVVENTCPFSGGRKNVINSKYRKNAINGHDSEFLSLGAAIENISLATHSFGLATVIIADIVAEEEECKKLLLIEGDVVVALPIGYPTYTPGKKVLKSNLIKYL